MTRILIADDHTLFRQGLKRLLEDAPELEVAGEARDGLEALEMARSGAWDLMLLDINLPGLGGLEVLQRMRVEGIGLPVLVLSMYAPEHYAAQVTRLGAAGYIDKDCSAEQLIDAMDTVSKGGSYLEPGCASDLFFRLARGDDELPHRRLSTRELEVFLNLAKGHTITGIAAGMGINAKTVSTYRARILHKLDMANNADIVRYALAHHLI